MGTDMEAARAKQRRLSAAADKRGLAERRRVVEHLKEIPCTDCRREYPFYVMDFDHRDPSTKEFEINWAVARRAWGKVLAEIEKCDVVCTCCHRRRSWREPERLNARQRLIRDLKAVPCADCSGVFPYYQMDFDHARGEKLGQVPKMGSHAAIRQEAAKCDVVCANCHRKRSDKAKRGTPRAILSESDMIWKHRSRISPQTHVLHRSWHPFAGTMSDGKVAAMGGVTRVAVRKYRKKLGLPSFRSEVLHG